MRPAMAELTSGHAALLHHDPRLDRRGPVTRRVATAFDELTLVI